MRMSSPRVITVSTGTVLRTIFILLALVVAWLVRDILCYVFLAFLLAGILYPFARWAERHKIPKALAVIAVYILIVGALALLLALMLPVIVGEVRSIPSAYGSSFGWASGWISVVKAWVARLVVDTDWSSTLLGIQGQMQDLVGNLFSTLTGAVGALAGVVIVFVLSFYIIIEEPAIKRAFQDLVPEEHREYATQFATRVMNRLGDWMRGEIVLMVILGMLYLVVYLVLGVPFPVLLALLGGFMEFIPYLGPIISGIPAILLALTISPGHAIAAFVCMIVIHELESNLIAPKVMQKSVGLNPVISIIAFLVGLQLFGVVGGIIAIPVATCGSLAYSEWLAFKRKRNG